MLSVAAAVAGVLLLALAVQSVRAGRANAEALLAKGRQDKAEAALAAVQAERDALRRTAVVDVQSLDKAAQRLADAQSAALDRAVPGDGAEALRKAFKP